MDRIGNYLALKYDLNAFRVNSDVGSTTRTAAVSKNCGCSGGPPWIPCSTTMGPYCAEGAQCERQSQTIKVKAFTSYLDLPMALVSVPAAGGTVISITGQVLTLLALLVQKYKY
jgi:hypothetical protein